MEEVVNRVSVRGWYDPRYAVLIDHEGYTPVVAAQVQIEYTTEYTINKEYSINKKVDRDAIDFAIRRLEQPFLVIPNSNDLISNSGEHRVEFSKAGGLYVLEKELTFPRPRPKISDLTKKLRKDYVAWIVNREEVYRLWMLRYAQSHDYIELTIPEDFEQLQGDLYYRSVEIDEETKHSLPLRTNFRVFNHRFEYDIYAVSFIHDNAVYAIVDTPDTCIHSEDHETATLKHGQYLLYHPFPRR